MGNENEDAPVLNVDETASGDALVENSGAEETPATPVVNENEEPEIEAFDPRAFGQTEAEAVASTDEGEDKPDTPDAADTPDADNDVAWDDVTAKPDDAATPESTPDASTEDKADAPVVENPDASVMKPEFKEFVSELGLEAETMDDVKGVLETLVAENARLKEENKEPVSNKRLEDLNNFLKLDDENLVRKSFEADGLKGDKLDNVIDRLLDNGMIDVEALKIRNNVDQAIRTESQDEIQREEADVAKQQEAHTTAVNKFSDFMQSTDSLGGFKLTGNPDNLPSVRKAHTEYVTSGDYLNEISSSEKNLAESSWLWRNRETLKNAMINNGRQNGRKEILDQIGNPDSGKPSRFVTPDTGEFNPQKFTQIN
tara:strand:+ start:114 stop:1226 length:1113 start_codon:yes stop_codon:yes gene_type:complete